MAREVERRPGETGLANPDGLIARALWQAHHLVERALDSALAPLGLSTTLVGTMAFVAQEPGLSTADLARYARVKPQSAAHAVNRLAELGLIDRSPHPVHGRVVQLYLTDRGRTELIRASEVAGATERELTSGLSESARRDLLRQLDQLRAKAERFTTGDSGRSPSA
jgi:DNA-binding MarR family transcriptional regulator